nr:MAG TPA: hypothetical protein [Caudoviricetes sp.]
MVVEIQQTVIIINRSYTAPVKRLMLLKIH